MSKIHTRQKRLLGITSLHRMHRYFFTNVVAKKGAKSFTDKDKAHAWAKEQKLDTKKYELYELPSGKKWQWRLNARD
ncbi:TPA: hypothetical protein HA251_07595 [Candidatus Woesearchaeota archaeon]|nr:hypothetical protein [Candidatus Woesearchaeota archaeon]